MRLLMLASLVTCTLVYAFTAQANTPSEAPTLKAEQTQSCSAMTWPVFKLDLTEKFPACDEQTHGVEQAGQGCCSHHGGVCGCAGDRAMCCDGQLSPSCGC